MDILLRVVLNDMSDNIRRFVLSFLNKSEYTVAFNEEMICDENTGEILICTRDGDIISYDALSRYNTHEHTLCSNANIYGLSGDVYDIAPDDFELPCEIRRGANILGTPVIFNRSAKAMVVSLDCDYINTVRNELSTHLSTNLEMVIDIGLGLDGVQLTTSTIKSTVSKLNTLTIDINKLYSGEWNEIYINSISVDHMSTSVNMRVVLHSILIVFQ